MVQDELLVRSIHQGGKGVGDNYALLLFSKEKRSPNAPPCAGRFAFCGFPLAAGAKSDAVMPSGRSVGRRARESGSSTDLVTSFSSGEKCLMASNCKRNSSSGPRSPSSNSRASVLIALAAISQWHQALIADDFDAYSWVAARCVDEGDALRAVAFDRMRQGVPTTIFAYEGTHDFDKLASETDRGILEGLKTFSLVGCLRLPVKGRSVQVMSVVSVREIEGRRRVYGESFGTPSTPFAGDCPITVTPTKRNKGAVAGQAISR